MAESSGLVVFYQFWIENKVKTLYKDVYQVLLSLFKDWLALSAPIEHIIKELFQDNRVGYQEMWLVLARDF